MKAVIRGKQFSQKHCVLLWLAFVAGCFVLYSNGLDVGYFNDDWQLVFQDPSSMLSRPFTPAPHARAYLRPFKTLLLAFVQSMWGWNTVAIHIVHNLCHASLAFLVYLALIRLSFTRIQAAIAGVFFLCSQIATNAVVNNDTFCLLGTALCGCWSLYYLHNSLVVRRSAAEDPKDRLRWFIYTASVLLYVMALLSKEQGVAYLPMLALIVAAQYVAAEKSRSLLRATLVLMPYVLLIMGYFALRELVGAGGAQWDDHHPRHFWIGMNIVRNIGMSVIAPLQSIATYKLFAAFHAKDTAIIILGLVCILALAIPVVYGLLLSKRYRMVMFLGAFAVLGMFPTGLLNHIGELYVYNSLAFFAALIGIGLGACIEHLVARWQKLGLAAVITCLLISNIIAVQQKVSRMKQNGKDASALLAKIDALSNTLPPNGQLTLVNGPRTGREYSIYVLTEFDLFDNAVHLPRYLTRRDIVIDKLQWDEYRACRAKARGLVLFLDGNTAHTQEPGG